MRKKIKWLNKIIPEPNGCGPEGLQWLVYDLIFKKSCYLHDNLFALEMGLWRSNVEFYSSMRREIYDKRRKLNCWKKVLYEIIALGYFLSVALFGWIFYYKLPSKFKILFMRFFNIK